MVRLAAGMLYFLYSLRTTQTPFGYYAVVVIAIKNELYFYSTFREVSLMSSPQLRSELKKPGHVW